MLVREPVRSPAVGLLRVAAALTAALALAASLAALTTAGHAAGGTRR